MTIDQTDDRDPFAFGRRNAEPETVGAAPPGSAAFDFTDECAASDETLFALIAEHRRLDIESGRLHADVERLEKETLSALPKAEVEYGFSIDPEGKRTTFVATTEEQIDASLAPRKQSEFRQRLDELLGREQVLYYDRRDELVAELSARKAAFDEQWEAAGVDAAFAKADECEDRVDANMDKILSIYPSTLAGADAVRALADKCQLEALRDHVVECYRMLAGGRRRGDEQVLSLFGNGSRPRATTKLRGAIRKTPPPIDC
jgi:phage shock protein A